MERTTGDPDGTARSGERYWRLLRRFAAASAVATVGSQLVFVASYALGATALLATGLGWLTGASLNFGLNRRNWGRHGRSGLRGEILRFAVISAATALVAAVATSYSEQLALEVFAHSRSAQVVMVWAAFLGTYLVMFVAKFFLMDRLVFTDHRRSEPLR